MCKRFSETEADLESLRPHRLEKGGKHAGIRLYQRPLRHVRPQDGLETREVKEASLQRCPGCRRQPTRPPRAAETSGSQAHERGLQLLAYGALHGADTGAHMPERWSFAMCA